MSSVLGNFSEVVVNFQLQTSDVIYDVINLGLDDFKGVCEDALEGGNILFTQASSTQVKNGHFKCERET